MLPPSQCLPKQLSSLEVGVPDQLNSTEATFWRALMRIVLTLPRSFDRKLVQKADVTANEYVTLMYLSEASDRQLRMTDLAEATALSAVA